MSTLYVLGNGFDLHHGLPTSYKEHLKPLACKAERFPGEWESYSFDGDLWSNVEELLARPDLDVVLEHLDQWAPDLLSERESDRDAIIHEAEQLLGFPLEDFARGADDALASTAPLPKFAGLFGPDDHFLTFNYTHTLQWLYGVPPERILHLHGEVGASRLILGYEPGSLQGAAVLAQFDHEETFEFYHSRAYDAVRQRLEEFEKAYQHDALTEFVRRMPQPPDRIVVFGHSLGRVDKPYFERLARAFEHAEWTVTAHDEETLGAVCHAMDAFGLGVAYESHVL